MLRVGSQRHKKMITKQLKRQKKLKMKQFCLTHVMKCSPKRNPRKHPGEKPAMKSWVKGKKVIKNQIIT